MSQKNFIQKYVSDAPQLPGIYKFLAPDNTILYIGKAKDIKKRLSQYGLKLSSKNEKMISLATSIEYHITESESAALLLEAQLIRKFKPKFNIALKDDSSFPYIKLRTNHQYPQLMKFRGKNLENGEFFGPFASANYIEVALKELQTIFKLRSCSDSFFSSRKRPCLQYQIQRCSAPCVGKISKQEYDESVLEVRSFLSGKNHLLQTKLAKKMEEFSKNQEYEKAAVIRDKIKAISYVQLKSQKSNVLTDADIIAVSSSSGEFCVGILIYRQSHLCGYHPYFPENTDTQSSQEEVITNFLMQLYQNKTPPKTLILSHKINQPSIYQNALSSLHKKKVSIISPKSGKNYEIVQNALKNTEISLANHLKKSAKNIASLEKIRDLFNLPEIPMRIEVYDNSHIQGAFAVGAMIVAGVNGFEKKEYRLFNMKIDDKNTSIQMGDDYAMLSHVLKRRLMRINSEPHRKPDLIIIDGGKGHMKTTEKVMNELNIHIPFICISKGIERNSGRENFHSLMKESFTLNRDLPVMKYLQILRDEAHNFAIKSHRKKRSRAVTTSSLDLVNGIGKIKKTALLNYFGSFDAIKDATEKELQSVTGINKKLAQHIRKTIAN
ncbi:MAG TPA: excinuclease ABC subunit UvrC [Candidatus Megaira endosymbiont of Nemacystus decipiens]|nr:excinuclease ABC subunit UvrC [Candidatus Megaera endosymbiont of Nemacystus decipiens]